MDGTLKKQREIKLWTHNLKMAWVSFSCLKVEAET